MKRILPVLIPLALTLLLGLPGLSQPPMQQQRKGGALEAMKIAFITKRLDLSPEDAEKFWPIYYKYAAEVRQAYFAYRDDKDEIKLDESLLNIRKKYNPEFTRALSSPARVNDFFRAEKDFGAFVQKEMQRRQMQRRPYGGGQ
ncbi:MAG TPA: hypothetical protein VL832_02115 [Puia sp.]|jgi:hypothetical protein|nr:hypothetical protein [Puia sp.]